MRTFGTWRGRQFTTRCGGWGAWTGDDKPRERDAGHPARRPARRLRLPAGDVLFEKVRVLEADELDREAVLDVPDHATGGLAERDERANVGPLIAHDRGARLRNVDDAAGQVDAVGQDQSRHRIARGDAAIAAVLRQSENASVGEPGELGGELVALARRRRDGHGEAVLELPRNDAFQTPDMIHIGNDPLAGLAGDGRDQS